MTEFEFEILKFLYYLLSVVIFVVKIAFLALVLFMLIDFIIILLKDMKNNIKK